MNSSLDMSMFLRRSSLFFINIDIGPSTNALFPHLLAGFIELPVRFPTGSPCFGAVDRVLQLSLALNFAQGFSGDPFSVLVLLWT